MKKLIAFAALISLLLSLGTVFAAAELPPVEWAQGSYASGRADNYFPLEDIPISWLPGLGGRVDPTDGDLSEWYALGIYETGVYPENMIVWENPTEITNWKMLTMYAADADNLYMAFNVVDEDFAYTTLQHDGDTIEICLDFGCKRLEAAEMYPELFSLPLNVRYAFSCEADGEALVVERTDSDGYGVVEHAVGAARRTERGWSAELALPWKILYEDCKGRILPNDPRAWVGAQEQIPLYVGISLVYTNRAADGTDLWKAGAVKENLNGNGQPCVSMTVYDNAARLTLDPKAAILLNCDGIVGVHDLYPMEEIHTTEEGTFTVVEPEPMPPVWVDTVEDDTVENDAKDEELQAVLAKYGCTSIVGMGSIALLTALAAAAYILKRS